MRAYVIRYNDPQHGTCSAEVTAGTEADARADFKRRFPQADILASYEKPVKNIVVGR
ncbi:hypothetical protein [Paenibacillus oleatilyticus]|uniref:hypothetical protein n=1 Tax=Paenibacillus oleatilyticus TaxID=2594886 RepID=UPI001C1F5515|nr:hypothetical protein [Paenibacillus oleatilyticus]MBU7320838.1 hypothetical protein [Paenibacillus oleatilyticus]